MPKHTLPGMLAASLVLVGASAVACSGGAPSDASEDDFCKEFTSLSSQLGSLADTSQKQALVAIKAWAKGLEKVGTPESMSDEARDGFELMIKEVAALDGTDTTEDFQKLDDELSASEKKTNLAVHGRTGEKCPVCGDVVREVSFADSSLQYCATCQTGGKPLADRRMSKLLK